MNNRHKPVNIKNKQKTKNIKEIYELTGRYIHMIATSATSWCAAAGT